MNDLNEIRILAESKIAQYLDSEWSFAFNNHKRSHGICNYKKKEIQLSRNSALHESMDKVLDTILHEIAHAMVGPEAGHGPIWRNVALVIGCSVNVTADVSEAHGEALAKSITHVVVDTTRNQVVKTYLRKPSANTMNSIQNMFIRGRRFETKGKLVIEKYDHKKHKVK